ncbi:heavy metal translocating P-type ATPase [Nocardia sp. NBC_01329]|uniref:heavy metal translocating P-type ATPase n=1 Tax=Nocardia sp. NBC_01329 TaxID=2903594 RepID=UPI002E0E6936|nr:cation-translocating P-type ATPase [Nocardia sp. NBC_01329]
MTATPAPETPARQRVHLRIAGMTCAACADRVRRGLEQLEQTTATVNIATGTAEVHTLPWYRAEDFRQVVETAGYTVVPHPPTPEPPNNTPRTTTSPRAAVAVTVLTTATVLAATVFGSGTSTAPEFLLFALAAIAVAGAAAPIHTAAWRAARRGHTTMDTLTSLGLLGTLTYAAVATVGAADGVRYSAVATAVTMVALAGRRLKTRAERRAGASLRDLAARFARYATVLDDSGRETRLPVGELREGQRFRVGPGDIVAADGLVVDGAADLDVSVLTGETTPVPTATGDTVTAGSVALDGTLVIEAAAIGDRTRLARLLHAVERSTDERGDFQRLADRIAGRFVPASFALAALAGTGWLIVAGPDSAARAGLAVLLAACPCTLGLATPTAVLVAAGRAAQLGIFVKGQRVLEQAEGSAVVVFDKTGTLTDGAPAVVGVFPAATVSRRDVLCWAAAAESGSAHSVALAVRAAARAEDHDVPEARAVTEYPGSGVLGIAEGRRLAVGRPAFLRRHGFAVPADLAAQRRAQEQLGHTTVYVGAGDRVVGVIAVTERVHPAAARAIVQLHGLGLRTLLLTGDNPFAAQSVADRVGIGEVVAGVLPEDKAEVVTRLQESGRHVMFVGDGINDGPALAAADVGIALGTGADAAIDAADIVLAGRDLLRVPAAIGLAWATLATIRTNLRWAFGYNVVVVPMAALLLDPLAAAAAMAVSSLFVVSNSMRLRRFTPPGPSPQPTAVPEKVRR